MGLSSEEIQAARKMSGFVRNYETEQRIHPMLKWVGMAGPFLTALLFIYDGTPYADYMFAVVAAGTFGNFVASLERKRRYLEAVVVLKVLERDHPAALDAIKNEPAKVRSSSLWTWGLYEPTKKEQGLVKKPVAL